MIAPSHDSDVDDDGNKMQRLRENVWKDSPVTPEHAIRGFHSATLSEEGFDRTAALLTDTMGFKLVAKDNEEGRFRFKIETNHDDYYSNYNNVTNSTNDKKQYTIHQPIGSIVDVVCQPDIYNGYVGVGTVHHIAWRAASDKHQLDLRRRIIEEASLNPTPVIDRTYFHSVYFREPGGILFEIATDPPGFTIDATSENLGHSLMLPEWLEPLRGRLQNILPPIKLPRLNMAENTEESAIK